ncbi:MAG: hypothetical protein A2821_00350 [Candidatus Magasanikbacteria bacterium RIFCSPHIGHO2_01_FULL_41_23]|uniref:Uncharacterized protein n=1 Tax=Candidatus Magasanikbacteria bacterium RIFCSPLOWO2_01_FULL_40_15 TaxID=1798686 RepID=A0A1F6N0C8_9BACT|nr:MAG: hypothetical protein A2821_00350 [Candidatus Magasanikbacteria bacterium RIFCSPHIGHO2_01_FULL_41_23]OGH74629.1 MAG: hypothetical protein A3F22_01705 [Candidatus Magasanikbacteria bacterium RIFCSPHIGHO2_12_FULL_41_16]OGH77342.1 MAG: hypothetical protein A2983_01405 [Candidatus Magasanikbacteria bacterium RIFCSPLOWO2_01_FULL_40_15]
MKSQKISSGFILGAILLNLVLGLPTKATDCPLTAQTAYKTKLSSAVYYITRQCTKRVFLNETTYFAYFSLWNQVKIVNDTALANIPDDARGPMRLKTDAPVLTVPTNQPKSEEKEVKTPRILETKPIPIVKSDAENKISTETKNPHPAVTVPTKINIITEFLNCPTEAERAKSENDFVINWNNDWNSYPFSCEYKNTKATHLPLYGTLRLLKNISFTKPLPFTSEIGLYEYLTATKLSLTPRQNCADYSTGWNYTINLGGTFAHTHAVKSGSANCEPSTGSGADLLDGFVYNPIYKAATFVHEAHHAINASTHTGKNGEDKDINENSAWAAQFYFYAWINLYGENVDATTKLLAKNAAADILNNRFSENKCPTDADLKNVVNTIVPNICK